MTSPVRRFLPGLILLVTLCAGAASAQAHDVERYLTAAARLYENLEYERALEQVERARRVSRGVADDVVIALYEGILLADLGRRDDARAAFKTGLLLEPNAKLPVKVSPKVERDFEDLRVEVKRELAPIQARREAEQRVREEEARRAREAQAREEAAQRSRDEAAQRSRDEAAQRSRDEAARRSREEAAQRSREEAARRAREAAQADRPERGKILEVRPSEPPPPIAAVETPVTPARRTPVLPFVFGGLAAAAAGGGAYFGLQSDGQVAAARQAHWRDEAAAHLGEARGSARVANILFATAGAAALGALVSLVSSGGDAPPASAAGPQPL